MVTLTGRSRIAVIASGAALVLAVAGGGVLLLTSSPVPKPGLSAMLPITTPTASPDSSTPTPASTVVPDGVQPTGLPNGEGSMVGSFDQADPNALVGEKALMEANGGTPIPTLMNNKALPKSSVVGEVTDQTAVLMSYFGTSVANLGSRISDGQPDRVVTANDQCLIDWAVSALPAYDGKSFIGVDTVCGQSAAIMVAGYGPTGVDMVGRAIDNDSDAALRSVLFGHQTLKIGAAATSNFGANIMVVTVGT